MAGLLAQRQADRRTIRGLDGMSPTRGRMMDNTSWESFKADTENVAARIKALVHEGNVRCIVIQHEGRAVAEFPLTAGVIGVVLAPVLAAIGVLVALLQDCTIHVEKAEQVHDERRRVAVR
jgi:hypothetical protein